MKKLKKLEKKTEEKKSKRKSPLDCFFDDYKPMKVDSFESAEHQQLSISLKRINDDTALYGVYLTQYMLNKRPKEIYISLKELNTLIEYLQDLSDFCFEQNIEFDS